MQLIRICDIDRTRMKIHGQMVVHSSINYRSRVWSKRRNSCLHLIDNDCTFLTYMIRTNVQCGKMEFSIPSLYHIVSKSFKLEIVNFISINFAYGLVIYKLCIHDLSCVNIYRYYITTSKLLSSETVCKLIDLFSFSWIFIIFNAPMRKWNSFVCKCSCYENMLIDASVNIDLPGMFS